MLLNIGLPNLTNVVHNFTGKKYKTGDCGVKKKPPGRIIYLHKKKKILLKL